MRLADPHPPPAPDPQSRKPSLTSGADNDKVYKYTSARSARTHKVYKELNPSPHLHQVRKAANPASGKDSDKVYKELNLSPHLLQVNALSTFPLSTHSFHFSTFHFPAFHPLSTFPLFTSPLPTFPTIHFPPAPGRCRRCALTAWPRVPACTRLVCISTQYLFNFFSGFLVSGFELGLVVGSF